MGRQKEIEFAPQITNLPKMSKLGFLYVGGTRIPLRPRFEYRGRIFGAAQVNDAEGPVLQLRCITDYQEALTRAENAAAAVEIAQRRDIEMLEAERIVLASKIGQEDADAKDDDADALDRIRVINMLIANHTQQIKDAVVTINATTYITEMRQGVAYTPITGWFAQDTIWCRERAEMGSILLDIMPVSAEPYIKQQELLICGAKQWWKFNGRGYLRTREADTFYDGAVACVNGSLVYEIGGYASDNTDLSAEIRIWDLVMNDWVKNGIYMPYGRAHSAVMKWRDTFIISGGIDDGMRITRTVTSTKDMKTFTSMPVMNYKRSSHIMIVCNDVLYVCGGDSDNGYARSVERYNSEDEEWAIIKQPPSSMHGIIGAVAWDGCVYVFGNDGKSWRYDPATEEWTALAGCPVRHNSPVSAHVVGSYAYLLANKPCRYCFDTDSWETLEAPPFEWEDCMRVAPFSA